MAPYVLPEGFVELRYSLSAPLPIRLELFDVYGRRLQVVTHDEALCLPIQMVDSTLASCHGRAGLVR